MEFIRYYDMPIGKVGIAEDSGAITKLFFAQDAPAGAENASNASLAANDACLKEHDSPLIQKTLSALQEYFEKKRHSFDDIPLAPKGTAFQLSVWKALCEIPYGETRSYKDIALAIGNEKACRAVGMANNRNPIAIMVPCHRVIGVNGALVGYAGGLSVKKYLLALESK